MATDKNISIGHDGGLIEWSATSDPTPPTITITGTTWATVNGANVTVQPNTDSSTRTATITVQASTTANTDYNGTASVTSAYTLTQEAMAQTLKTIIIHFENWTCFYSLSPGAEDDGRGLGCEIRISVEEDSVVSNYQHAAIDRIGNGESKMFELMDFAVTVPATATTITLGVQCSPYHDKFGTNLVEMSGALGNFVSVDGEFKNLPYNIGTQTNVTIAGVEFKCSMG